MAYTDIDYKYNNLEQYLKELGNVAIGCSGGVDSTFLAVAASRVLEKNVLALVADTPYMLKNEIENAVAFFLNQNIRCKIIRIEVPDIILSNPYDRCYHCKKHLFSIFRHEADLNEIPHLLDGSNADDHHEYRPGQKALNELMVISPLIMSGLSKDDIRQFSKEWNLPTWNKPANACLLTRIPYNTTITTKELYQIQKGEEFLNAIGFTGVRLRSHGDIARLELPSMNLNLMLDNHIKSQIIYYIKSLGYRFVCIDLEGYRTGSFDPSIPDEITKKR
jgi:uncharacterized protein (TIGR00268 family)